MRLFLIEPEVAGEIGENTIYENYNDIIDKGALPMISHLHFIFKGWLGDDILEVTPCFLVSERLKETIQKEQLVGCEFRNIEVSLSDDFIEMYPNKKIPNFFQLLPLGTICLDEGTYTNCDNMDFSISEKSYLILSEKAKDIIELYYSKNADISEIYPQE